ncbi:MAG TPA: hypothetical protein VK622_14490 [Puia sp.]|nr:hypothetical protein [Puia sp.]
MPKPPIPADAGNFTDNTNMGQMEGDTSEFGSVLGKFFHFILIPAAIHSRKPGICVLIAFG